MFELLPDFLESNMLRVLEKRGCKAYIEAWESIFEHLIELVFVEQHLPDVFLKEIIVRRLVVLQRLDSFDELLYSHEDRLRFTLSKLLLQLKSLLSIVLVVFPRDFVLIDHGHDCVAEGLKVVPSEAIKELERIDRAVEDRSLEAQYILMGQMDTILNELCSKAEVNDFDHTILDHEVVVLDVSMDVV